MIIDALGWIAGAALAVALFGWFARKLVGFAVDVVGLIVLTLAVAAVWVVNWWRERVRG